MWKNRSFCGYVYDRKWHGESLFVGDREKEIEKWVFLKERNVFFSETLTSQRRTVVRHHTHTLTLTNTLTLSHTHMTGQPWLAGQVVPEELFLGFAKYFWPKWSARIFFGLPGGHARYENIILRELIVSFIYVSNFVQALCCKVYV